MKNLFQNYLPLWRSNFNPLRGLDMRRAIALMEQGELGAYADVQFVYRMIEKRDATLRGTKRRLRGAIKKLDWNIKVIDQMAEGQEALAKRQEDALREVYEKIDNFRKALEHLVLAEYRGFSHLEKHYKQENGRWVISHLEPVPQWNWVREGMFGDWEYNREAVSGTYKGDPVDLNHFIVREVEDPISELCLPLFIFKNFSIKDWAGFIETYGIPFIFLILPELANDDEFAKKFQAVVHAVTGGSRGVLPNGSDIKTADSKTTGAQPFKEFLDYLDSQIVLAATGGKLTMLNEATGIGSGASDAHQDSFDDIAQDLAMDISECLQEQIDIPFLDEMFPGQDRLVYFELAAVDQEDVTEILDHAVKANQAGYEIEPTELSEKTGYTFVDAPVAEGEKIIRTLNRRGREKDFLQSSRIDFAKSLAEDLKPLRNRLAEVLQIEDETKQREAMNALQMESKELFLKMAQSGQAAQSLEKILVSSVVNGADESKANQLNKTEENTDA